MFSINNYNIKLIYWNALNNDLEKKQFKANITTPTGRR